MLWKFVLALMQDTILDQFQISFAQYSLYEVTHTVLYMIESDRSDWELITDKLIILSADQNKH